MKIAAATDRRAARDVLKDAIKRRVPPDLLHGGRRRYAAFRAGPARRAFATAGAAPQWLDSHQLDRLQERYPDAGGPRYDYDAASLDRRGAERMHALRPSLRGTGDNTLELACGDGMVSYHLARAGARAVAVDLTDNLFDERAHRAGVRLVQADAAALPFRDAEFDLVVSFNGFEHVPDPQAVLREATRVTKAGGAIYLNFGPLYWSSYGLHALRSITVPFCHLLFERPALESYVRSHDLKPIPFETLNCWTLAEFRDLWTRYADVLEAEVYRETPNVRGIELVAEHPSCFRAKTDDFDNLLVAVIEARFRRRSSGRTTD